jgi:hypothetical protein
MAIFYALECPLTMLRSATATILIFLMQQISFVHAQSCGQKQYCREMESCVEARFYLEKCGLVRLDGDSDGSPCEKLCGDGGNRPTSKTKSFKPPRPLDDLVGKNSFKCGAKKSCREMVNCAEATFQLQQCGLKKLDGNNDGIACNSICGGESPLTQ